MSAAHAATEADPLRRRLERERAVRREAELVAERATRELYEKQRGLQLLQTITAAANQASTVEEGLRDALDAVCAHVRWPVGHAYMLQGDELVSTRVWHLEDAARFEVFREVSEATRFPVGIGLPGRVLASREPEWIVDVTKDPNFPRARAVETDIGVRGAFATPLMVGTDVVGVLELFTDAPAERDDAILELMAPVGIQLGRMIERQRAAGEILRGRAELQDHLDAMTTFTVKVSPDAKVMAYNRVAAAASGLPEEEIIGTDLLEGQWFAFDAEVQARVRAAFERAVAGEPVLYDEKMRLPDGRVIVINMGIVPVRDESGEIAYLIGEGRDITAQKEAERRLAEAQSIAHVGSWEWDVRADEVSWSDELYRIYGLEPGTGVASYESFLDRVHPDDAKVVDSGVRAAFADPGSFGFEHRIVRPDGAVRTLQARGEVAVGDDGRPAKMFGTGQDITARKRVELELVRHRDHLEELVEKRTRALAAANNELEAFSYSVSHDLRAPLRAIDGFSQALLEDCRDRLDANGKDHLRRVRAATERMGRLIDDMLELSRVSQVQLEREPLDLSRMARDVCDSLRATQRDRQVTILVQDGVDAEADPLLLSVVLENLLGNAWKFTSRQPRATIEFGVTERDGRPAYFVRDDGAGFDMAYADKLFRPFQRLHPVADFEGTGIGLATVQRIVHAHGGEVAAEGEVGKGATLYFTLR